MALSPKTRDTIYLIVSHFESPSSTSLPYTANRRRRDRVPSPPPPFYSVFRCTNTCSRFFSHQFLLIHIPATLLVDVQAIFFAESISSPFLRQIFAFAAKDDPLLTNANNLPQFAWFQCFICLEIVFQVSAHLVASPSAPRASGSRFVSQRAHQPCLRCFL